MNIFLVNILEFWNTYLTELTMMLFGTSIIAFCTGWIGRSFKVSRLVKIISESDQDFLRLDQKLKVVEATERSILIENAKMKKVEFDLNHKIKALKLIEKQYREDLQKSKRQIAALEKEKQLKIIPIGKKETETNENLKPVGSKARLIAINVQEKQIKTQNVKTETSGPKIEEQAKLLVDTKALSKLDLSNSLDIDATKNLTAFAQNADKWNEEVYFKSYQEMINLDAIGQPDKYNPDDLTRLSGIGIRIEQKMNRLGIYNYSQIKNLRESDLSIINEAINFLPERIKLEDWKNEALELLIVN